ncbi:MAG: hypothetical protein HXX16_20335 [Bacteroidales bacterium]|nr:hypothetical protein [Bacteroidales bacterium]
MNDKRVILSILWIFLSVNYIFCDVLSIMDPGFFKLLMSGGGESVNQINQGLLLGFAILVEIPFAMIILSRLLHYRANRWANIIAGSFMAVIQLLSIVDDKVTLHYIFYSVIEIGCNSFIVWYAWKWSKPDESLKIKSN